MLPQICLKGNRVCKLIWMSWLLPRQQAISRVCALREVHFPKPGQARWKEIDAEKEGFTWTRDSLQTVGRWMPVSSMYLNISRVETKLRNFCKNAVIGHWIHPIIGQVFLSLWTLASLIQNAIKIKRMLTWDHFCHLSTAWSAPVTRKTLMRETLFDDSLEYGSIDLGGIDLGGIDLVGYGDGVDIATFQRQWARPQDERALVRRTRGCGHPQLVEGPMHCND